MAGNFASERLHHSNYGFSSHGFPCHPYVRSNPFQFDPRYNNAPFNHHMCFEGQNRPQLQSPSPNFDFSDSSFSSNHPRLRRSRTLPQEAMMKQFGNQRQIYRQQSINTASDNNATVSNIQPSKLNRSGIITSDLNTNDRRANLT